MAGLIILKFFLKWISEGRFPREELHIRWGIAVLGGIVVLPLVITLLVVWLR